jgi:sulfite exporter TauE/SafE
MNTRPNALPEPAPGRLRAALLKALTILLIGGGILLVMNLSNLLGMHPGLPVNGEQLSYALLFVAGLFTGFHCVGMCGALVVGYVVKAGADNGSKYFTHLYYGAGKLLSYTVIGGLFGALGAIISFTPYMRGLAGVASGIFLVLFGLSTLNLFPALARFRIKTPDFVMKRLGKAYRGTGSPFAIGLLNGLMVICGPLQAMYIMAAGTGDPLAGAKMLFVFGLGTLPMMLGFGVLASALSKQFAPKIVRASGVLVIVLGVIMLNRGLVMVGGGHDYSSLLARIGLAPHSMEHMEGPAPEPQVIRMTVTGNGFEPGEFALTQGVPVRWVIQGEAAEECDRRILVPALDLDFGVQPGENVVEFTPRRAGVIPWTCRMGTAHGVFRVAGNTPGPAADTMAGMHDHGAMMHGQGHGSASNGPPGQWMKELLERSSAAVENLRRNLIP